jgi:hypothetical protein
MTFLLPGQLIHWSYATILLSPGESLLPPSTDPSESLSSASDMVESVMRSPSRLVMLDAGIGDLLRVVEGKLRTGAEDGAEREWSDLLGGLISPISHNRRR